MNKPSDVTKRVLKKSKSLVIFRFFVSLIYRSLAMVIPILFSLAVDKATNNEYNSAISLALISIGVVILYRSFDIIATYAWHRLYNKMYETYTKIGIEKVFDNSLYSLSRFNIGEFLNIMTTDINVMCDFYCNLIMRLIRVFEVTIIFVYFFMINLYIGLAGILVAILSLTIIFISSKKIEKLNQTKSINYDNRGTIINEFLSSIREIKTFNIFDAMKERINKSTSDYTKSYLKQRVGEDMYKYSMLMLIEVFRWSLFIYGIVLISKGQMEIGSLLIIYNYYTQLVDGFSEFATINIGIRQLKVSERRFYQLIVYSHDKTLSSKKYRFTNYDIKFDNILYGDINNPRLNNVNFDIKGGNITSIVGLPGSGKSGIVDLLLRLNAQHLGVVSIDKKDIRTIDYEYYYKIVSSIDKEDKFLNISIKDNLKIVNDDFELIIDICKKLGIHDDIVMLKNGYDTILNSKDDTLKPNSKRLLNIARILLKNTKIMIFDGVLFELNKNSYLKVLDILEQIKNDHTIIIMDKELEIISKSDYIILLDNGMVVDKGTHEELINNSLYRQIVQK